MAFKLIVCVRMSRTLDEEELKTLDELECGVMLYRHNTVTNVRTEVYVNSSLANLSGMPTEEVLHVCACLSRNALRKECANYLYMDGMYSTYVMSCTLDAYTEPSHTYTYSLKGCVRNVSYVRYSHTYAVCTLLSAFGPRHQWDAICTPELKRCVGGDFCSVGATCPCNCGCNLWVQLVHPALLSFRLTLLFSLLRCKSYYIGSSAATCRPALLSWSFSA